MQSTPTRIVAIGGGHCNCQMLKLLKKKVLDSAAPMTMTLINESAVSYYSGMLPGTVSKLYTDEDLKIELAPLAKWCGAKYIQERVVKIEGN
jgi:selenide, water dikinase